MIIEHVAGFTLIHVMKQPYPIMLVFDGNQFINAELWAEDYHEIIIDEESLEGLCPGLLAEAKEKIA